MANPKGYEILGLGTPILDRIIKVDEEFLKYAPGAKGGMTPVDYETLSKVVKMAKGTQSVIAGGSGSNTIKGLANFGRPCALVGKIGNDSEATAFLKKHPALRDRSPILPKQYSHSSGCLPCHS